MLVFGLLIGGLFLFALQAFMFLFAWNVFVVEVLGFSRAVNIVEALAGSIGLNLIMGTLGAIAQRGSNALKDK